MNENQIRERWDEDKPIFDAWADYVRNKIIDTLRSSMMLDPDSLIKIPVSPRLKNTDSLIDKALHRNKAYTNPYEDITDKAGMRFVVLLSEEIKVIEKAILDITEWTSSKDKDYEEDRIRKPFEFAYQSVHYVVRSLSEIVHKNIVIPANIPCEIQIRTILQHAHSELTHDTIYKPKSTSSPEVQRAIAKSMALIEATDDFFSIAMEDLKRTFKMEKDVLDALSNLFTQKIGVTPGNAKSNFLIFDAFSKKIKADSANQVQALLESKPFIIEKINQRVSDNNLFRQPAILLTYLLSNTSPNETKELWPLTPDELSPIFLDLGLSFSN